MKILILGGTKFLGRHFMEEAAAAGHAVTIFHRGTTECPLPPAVRERRGDRETDDVTALGAESWDLVVDTSAYHPQTVMRSATALRDRTLRYLFISTISVYSDASAGGITEDAALAELPPGLAERPEVNEYYGPLKVQCERVVRDAFGSHATIVRPGLIVGPHDPTDRWTYWVERIARGGDVLAPGRPARRVQFIDARDVALFGLHLAEEESGGIYHAAGPLEPVTMEEMLQAGAAAIASREPVRLHWIDDKALQAAEVGAWMEMPLWIPDGDPFAGFMEVDLSRSAAAGLRTRPLELTFADTEAWAAALDPQRERKAGLAFERERELLTAGR